MIRTLARFLALPAAEQGRTVEAAVLLLVVRLALGLLPFPWALKLLRVSPGESTSGRIAAAEAADVSRAIARAAKAHAWSCCGDVPVTGVAVAGDFAPVAAFAA